MSAAAKLLAKFLKEKGGFMACQRCNDIVQGAQVPDHLGIFVCPDCGEKYRIKRQQGQFVSAVRVIGDGDKRKELRLASLG